MGLKYLNPCFVILLFMAMELELIFQPKHKAVEEHVFLFNKDDISIGRCPKTDIQINDGLVSSRHGKISIIGNEVLYNDYSVAGTELYKGGGREGKFFNNDCVTLNQGDVLKFGMYRLKLVEYK